MKPRLLLVVLTLVSLSLACNMPVPPTLTPQAATPNALTQVAETVQATAISEENITPTAPPETSVAASPTSGPSPTLGPPTQTRVPPTNTPQPCDQAGFLQDVTIPDGSKMTPGTAFTKTWRLRNLGTCTWSAQYALVFFGGDALGAPSAVNLKGDVSPGSTVDVSIDMKAPAAAGKYISYWKLRNAKGEVFALPEGQPIFAQIEVIAATPTLTQTGTATATPTITPSPTTAQGATLTPPATGILYDFVANVCKAEWLTAAEALNCPGTSADPGYVMKLEKPRLETGATENGPVIVTQPQTVENGVIAGRFPSVKVGQGHHFKATIGCLEGAAKCSVIYQLNFSIAGGEPSNLGQWQQINDGSIQGIDVDLSPLAGQSIEIVLVVLANGSAEQDLAVWVNPRIVKQ